MTASIHPALTVSNITNFIKITLDIEKSQYNTWSELFKIHAQAYDVLDHIIPTPTTNPSSSSPSLKETYPALWNRLDAIVLQWIYGTISTSLLHTIIERDPTAQTAWEHLFNIFFDNQNNTTSSRGRRVGSGNYPPWDSQWQPRLTPSCPYPNTGNRQQLVAPTHQSGVYPPWDSQWQQQLTPSCPYPNTGNRQQLVAPTHQSGVYPPWDSQWQQQLTPSCPYPNTGNRQQLVAPTHQSGVYPPWDSQWQQQLTPSCPYPNTGNWQQLVAPTHQSGVYPPWDSQWQQQLTPSFPYPNTGNRQQLVAPNHHSGVYPPWYSQWQQQLTPFPYPNTGNRQQLVARNHQSGVYPPWDSPWQPQLTPSCPYPNTGNRQQLVVPSHQSGILGQRSQQAHLISAQPSYTPTDIHAAMHALSIAPPAALPPSISSVTSVARKMSTSPPPIYPRFISVEASDIHSTTKSDGFRVSLVSFNILAQVYVKNTLFPHSPPLSLEWKYRSNSILDVLKNLGADFFCLQEIDEFYTFYKGRMLELGYSSIYMKRSGEQKRDGCGLFYKHDRAELVLEEKIEYNDLVKSIQDENSSNDDEHNNVQTTQADKQKDDTTKSGPKSGTEDRGDPNDPRVRLKRDCVGILAAFKFKGPSNQFLIVANTHIYWDPEWADVKLAQARYLLSRLSQFKTLVSHKYERIPEVIVAGDFNSLPGDMVYQYLISGNPSSELTTDYVDERPIPLSSVYASTRGEPPFTNCTPRFTGTLDYILFSPSNYIKPISYLELPDSEAADIVGGLPNFSHPSDHLPIGAEFEINKD
ncbi:unnamed protein product [Trifolium pratense]|nr:unnamed protein product [Trifolium pratense]